MSDADPRRDQIARVIYETRYGEPWFEALDGAGRAGAMREADAVLPILRAAVEQARADTAEQIAQELARVPDEVYPKDVFGDTWTLDEAREANNLLRDAGLPTYDRVGATAMRRAHTVAADIARQHGRQP